jgi:ketosteroid isomerase-like protein
MASSAPVEVIQAFYAALAEGDVTTARDCWANDAVLHVTGRLTCRVTTSRTRFAMLGEWCTA